MLLFLAEGLFIFLIMSIYAFTAWVRAKVFYRLRIPEIYAVIPGLAEYGLCYAFGYGKRKASIVGASLVLSLVMLVTGMFWSMISAIVLFFIFALLYMPACTALTHRFGYRTWMSPIIAFAPCLGMLGIAFAKSPYDEGSYRG